jgi:predicted ATPase/class 3 adenylate cyclase
VAPPAGDAEPPNAVALRVNLLGPFVISLGPRSAGPWPRPTAKRLCELLLVSPGRRVRREAAGEVLFPERSRAVVARALSTALSNARTALATLGTGAPGLIRADRGYIWADASYPLEVDLDLHQQRLALALGSEPGSERDRMLVLALTEQGILLEDEPYADWAIYPRDQLERARQEARLALARDRAKGLGLSTPEAVVQAWEVCLSHDPSSEEAACALVRVYAAQKRPGLAEATYKRCRGALADLGLHPSPALEEVYATSGPVRGSAHRRAEGPPGPGQIPYKEERRPVTLLFAELSWEPGPGQKLGPEEVRELAGGALAGMVAQVEAMGGTVSSISGAGLVALFGAPVAHEDDPERALRAAHRGLDSLRARGRSISARVGVETGQAVVGPLVGSGGHYGAFGEVVAKAAALQSVAKRGSVLVGPATRTATDGSFFWGPTEEVVISPGAKGMVASYLERPKARPIGQAGRRGLAGAAPLVGRERELAFLYDVLRQATGGKGGVVLLTGEPGLGKTRLVHECRKLFVAWVGAGSGRLPLWLEGRAASYASSTPYGLYQKLVAAWLGVVPEDGEEVVRAALDRAVRAVSPNEAAAARVSLLCRMMGLEPADAGPAPLRLNPEQLQAATFDALRAVLSRLAAHGPTVLVLEDLHWADPTSLRLTEEICTVTKVAPLLLVLTRRPEPDPGVSALEAALAADKDLELLTLELCPLPQASEQDLARSLLSEGAADDVIVAVSRGVEGNPLFLEERLSSLLETGALANDGAGWRIDHGLSEEVPEALERLVRSRVDRLDLGPRDAIVAASVLGAEFNLGALRAVTDMDGDLASALSVLCAGGLLTELRKVPEPAYRFRHGLIQEATYKGLVSDERRRLHARAAWGLEAASGPRLEEVAGVLGNHFALAGETERARHYLELAADRAASAFANDEAIASYRYALAVAGRAAEEGSARWTDAWTKAVKVRARLAEVLLRTGRHEEAREALHDALGLVAGDDRRQAARLQALLGKVEIADHRYDQALAAFDAAEELMGEHLEEQDQASVDLWLEVQLDGRAYVHYWRNDPEKGAAVLAAARPVVEARGTPGRKQRFYFQFGAQRMRESRYRIDEDILTNLRAALAAAREGGDQEGTALTLFTLGFALLWYGDLDEAQRNMEESLAIVERTGDLVLRARCLCYLNVTALRRHDVDTVRSLAPQAMEAATVASYPEYVAMAKATQAWAAWVGDRPEEVVALSSEALEVWRTSIAVHSWYWVCLWPLISVRLAANQVGEAVEAARRLLVPPQQRLPDELGAAVQASIDAWEQGDPLSAMETLTAAIEMARQLRYA